MSRTIKFAVNLCLSLVLVFGEKVLLSVDRLKYFRLRLEFEVRCFYVFVVCRPLLLFLIFYGIIISVNIYDNIIFCEEYPSPLPGIDVGFDENGKVVRVGTFTRERWENPPPTVQKGIAIPLEREDYIKICMEIPNAFFTFPENRILGACVNDWSKFFDETLEPFLVNHKDGFKDLYDSPEYQVYWREEIKSNYISILVKESKRVENCECVGLQLVPSKPKYYPRRRF